MRVDAVVLDIDGVLVDVATSYRRAIVDTVDRLYGETIDLDAVQAFKEAGRFNNDWKLTDAACLFVLAKRNGFELNINGFTDAIAARGGGLEAAREVLTDAGFEIEDEWEPDRVREVFQQLYLGADLYRELEGDAPDIEADGYIHDESVLISQATVEALTTTYPIGILTGRPTAEAAIALDRVGLSVPPNYQVTMDDALPGKPEPDGLVALADRLDASAVPFVGDTLDDMTTVANARVNDDRTYYGIGVQTGGLKGPSGRRQFREAGANDVIASVNDLPARLTPV